MSVLPIVLGAVLLAGAAGEIGQALLLLTKRDFRLRWLRARPGTSKWRLLATALLDAAVGAMLISEVIRSPLAEWLALFSVPAAIMLIFDLQSWRRSWPERKLARAPEGHAAVLTSLENSGFSRRLRIAADGWEALKHRRENLDRRVTAGEITAETRDRYLKAHRRQLIRSLGYHNPVRWPERLLVSALLPVLDAQAVRLRAELTGSADPPALTRQR